MFGMIDIHSDNPSIKAVLERLLALLLRQGARLNPAIEIVSSSGQLSIRSKLPADHSDEIIFVPEHCLPCIADFDLTLDGDHILCAPRTDASASALQREIFGLMIDVFNLTGKIKAHRESFPTLASNVAPKIVFHLLEGAAIREAAPHHDLQEDQILRTFISSRRLKYISGDTARMVIQPVIDYLNHHHAAAVYARIEDKDVKRTGMAVFNSKPVPNSDECFVNYGGDNDGLSLFLKYGFVDRFAAVTRSIPLTIDLAARGRIVVNRTFIPKPALPVSVAAEQLPYPRDLHVYFPDVRRIGEDVLEISSLIVPSAAAPVALRRVLAIVIRMLVPHIDPSELKHQVYHAESSILKVNHAYYDELEALVAASEEKLSREMGAALHALVSLQRRHLVEYQERLAIAPI